MVRRSYRNGYSRIGRRSPKRWIFLKGPPDDLIPRELQHASDVSCHDFAYWKALMHIWNTMTCFNAIVTRLCFCVTPLCC